MAEVRGHIRRLKNTFGTRQALASMKAMMEQLGDYLDQGESGRTMGPPKELIRSMARDIAARSVYLVSSASDIEEETS